MIGATFALVMPALAAYLLLTRRWSGAGAAAGPALGAALAPGLGLGAASCVYFLLLQFAPNRSAALVDAATWLLIDILLLVGVIRAAILDRPAPFDRAASKTAPPAILAAAAGFAILFVVVACSFLLRYALRPEGEWDGFAIWNLRARSIARGAPDWATVLSPAIEWSSPHYPLLVPLTVARVWAYAGNETTVVPAAIGFLFLISSLAVVVMAVARLNGWVAGLLSGSAVLLARTYVYQGACQCADVPVGFYFLVAIGFVAMSYSAPTAGPLLVVSGAAAGLAAWTKDEGQLLLLLVPVAAMGRAPRLHRLRQLAVGAAVPLLTLASFKMQVQSSSYLVTAQSTSAIVEKLLDPSRWASVGGHIASLARAWGEVPGGAVVWLVLAAAITWRPDRASVTRACVGWLLVIGMFAGYGIVYVITPLALEWQIAVSFDRLFVQIWPALVWATFQLSGPFRVGPGGGALNRKPWAVSPATPSA